MRNRGQISLLILSKFDLINFYFPEIIRKCFLMISGGMELINVCSETPFRKNSFHIETNQLILLYKLSNWFLHDTRFY